MQPNKNLVAAVPEGGTAAPVGAVKAAEFQASEVPAEEVQASGGAPQAALGTAVSAEVQASGAEAAGTAEEVQASGGEPQAALGTAAPVGGAVSGAEASGTASEVQASGGAPQAALGTAAPVGGAVSSEVQASGAEEVQASGGEQLGSPPEVKAAEVQASGEGVVTVNGKPVTEQSTQEVVTVNGKPVTEQSKSGVLAPAGGTADLLTGKNDAQIMAGAEIAAVAVLAAASKIQDNPEPRKDTKIKSLFLDNLHLFFGDTHLKPIKDFIDPSHQLDETHEMNGMNEFDREDYEHDRLIKLLKTMFFRESNGIISKVFVGGGITIDQLKKKIKKGISLIVPKY